MRVELEALRDALRSSDPQMADRVDDALNGSDSEFRDFLVSNELWGGSGSIADQAGISRDGAQLEMRTAIEDALIRLGDAQIAAGIASPRTQLWIETFKGWQRRGI